jgi:ABC-type dipeptide/oligopeptide/nickel transport system ATPase subunit
MPIRKLEANQYAPRHWAIYGAPGAGKSTLAAQMAGPLAWIDADGRAQEIVKLANGEVYALDTYNGDVRLIVADMRASLPATNIQTLVIDSLTSLISPIVTAAQMEIDAGLHKNKVSAFKDKALAMRAIADAAIAGAPDVAFIYHTRQARDAQAHEVTATSISAVELARLRRSLNMVLRVDAQHAGAQGARTVTIEWARGGRSGITLEDTTGMWRGMPERIEMCAYDGLSKDEQAAMEKATPTSFTGPDAAIAWGYEQGCFRDAVHAANAYEEVKRLKQPQTAAMMWTLWVEEVQTRLAEKETV